MTHDIIEISQYFLNSSEDKEELKKLISVAGNKGQWIKAKTYFDQIRKKNLKIKENENNNLQYLYRYIEVCYKSLYNLTYPSAPFDAHSPYKIIPFALQYCNATGLEQTEIIRIIG